MEDPCASIIEKCIYSSSQEDLLNNSLFAREDDFLSDNDGGSPFPAGAPAASSGIVICSAPETPKSKDDIDTQNEEFKIPPEESRRSSSCEELPQFPHGGGGPKLDVSDSIGISRGQDSAASDSARANLKNKSALGVKENLGFSKARISEMMEILSDGKVRVRDAPKVEVEPVIGRKREINLKEDPSKPPSKKLKALAEENPVSMTTSPREGPEILKAELKAMTGIPLSLSAPENDQSTEPLETMPVNSDQEEAADFGYMEGYNSTKKNLNLPKVTTEEGVRGTNGGKGIEGGTEKIDYNSETEKQGQRDGGNPNKNGKICGGDHARSKGGDDAKGSTYGAQGRRNLPSSVLKPVDSGTIVDKDTMMRNIIDLLGIESIQTTKDGDGDRRAEKASDSDCRTKAAGNEPSAAVTENEGNTMKCLLGVLDFLTREVKRKYYRDDVDIYETAKRRGMTFPRPRWWPDSAGDDWRESWM